MEARFREAERLLLLDAFFFFLSSPSELLEADPVRAGTGATSSVGAAAPSTAGTAASSSAGLGVTSVLFLGADGAAEGASVVGFPSRDVSASAATGTSEHGDRLTRRVAHDVGI